MSVEVLKRFGFRWVQPTAATLRNGTPVLIAPTAYLQSRENLVSTPRGRAFLRLYRVSLLDRPPWEAVELREPEVESLLSA